jgi:hypothetical protein
VENAGMSTSKHQNPAEIDIEIQNTIGEQRREQGKKTMQGAYVHIHQTTRRIFLQETPEATLVAAQVYLLTTQPEPKDPREHMHQATIRSLGLVEDRLRKYSPERKVTYYDDKEKRNFKHQPSQSQTSESSGDEKRRAQREDVRNIIEQARVNNVRYAWKEENYGDNEKEMGALCFTRRVCRM